MKRIVFIIGVLIVASLFLIYTFIFSSNKCSKYYSKVAHEEFERSILSSAYVNSGIRLKEETKGFPAVLIIINVTNEPIRFLNDSFDVMGYTWNTQSLNWDNLNINLAGYHNSPVILKAKTLSIDTELLNVLYIGDHILRLNNTNFLRIVVSGRGVNTSKVYAAYYDLCLNGEE